jgi:hypothetical protein
MRDQRAILPAHSSLGAREEESQDFGKSTEEMRASSTLEEPPQNAPAEPVM